MTANVDQVVLWMVSGLTGDALANACIGKLQVDPAEVAGLIAEARKRVTLAAEYNRDELLGTSLTRLNDLYSRCIRAQETNKALAVQKEINRVVGLQAKPPVGDEDAEHKGDVDEMKAIAEYLIPLGLADESYPVREHARLAAQRIRELTSALEARGDDK